MAELAPTEAIAALRRPKVVYTEAYANDPIRFNVDQRFIPQTALSQLENIVVVNRDQTDFILVDGNADHSQYYSVGMFSKVYNKVDYYRTINKKFTQLI